MYADFLGLEGQLMTCLFRNKDSERKELFLATSSFIKALGTVYQWDRYQQSAF